VRVSEPMGSHTLVTGEAEGQPMRVIVAAGTSPAPGSILHLAPRRDHIAWMDAGTGIALETGA
jgi:hypothetical protein